jgi:hypothetical protein
MKFNWGWGIACVSIGFALFISAMVYRASQEKIEFVTDDYYGKELKFQEQINKEKNSLALTENIKATYDESLKQILIKYPSSFDSKTISGDITFFKPDNSDLDFTAAIKCSDDHLQEVSAAKMKKGWWTLKINWASNGTPYYHIQKILVS